MHRQEWTWLVVSLVFAALCKETLWLTSAWVAILLAVSYRKDREARYFWGLGALFLMGFVLLFKVWMPQHTSLEGYYGLSYYQNSAIDAQYGFAGQVLGAVLNMFSIQSIGTFAVSVVLIPAGLTLFGGYWALAGALPALVIVLAASNNQIHDLTNHYLIAALPFLAVAGAVGLDHVNARIKDLKAQSYLAFVAVMIPLTVTLLHQSGFVFQTLFATERMYFELKDAVANLRKELNPEDFILIDGSLQPLLNDLPNVKVILGFQGNPTHVRAEDLARVKHVITTNDLSELKDCRSVKPGAGDFTVFDYEGFYQYCEWLKKATIVKKEYIPNRLLDLKIETGPFSR